MSVSASASVPVMERPPETLQGPMPPVETYELDTPPPPAVEVPDQAAGTAGVYRSRNASVEEPTPHFETQETDVAEERVQAVARPLGNLATAGVAVVAESSYAEEFRDRRGLFVMQHQAAQQAVAALRAQEDQSRFFPSMVDTKKGKKGHKPTKNGQFGALGDDDPFKYLRSAAKTAPRIENGQNLN